MPAAIDHGGQLWSDAGTGIQRVIDVPPARKVYAEWPTEIVASGFEIGLAIKYPAVSIERDFGYVRTIPCPRRMCCIENAVRSRDVGSDQRALCGAAGSRLFHPLRAGHDHDRREECDPLRSRGRRQTSVF